MSIHISGVLQISISPLTPSDLNRVAVVELLAVFALVLAALEWAVRELDAAVTVKIALVDGVVLERAIESKGRLALAADIVVVVVLRTRLGLFHAV